MSGSKTKSLEESGDSMNESSNTSIKEMENKKSNKECKHTNWSRRLTNPHADGIEDVKVGEYYCIDCNKCLAEETWCISAHTIEVYDKDWGKCYHIESVWEPG
mmetsp:Transcript_21238/g.19338  ORF Transcript_21238/g.19338 Transcript_21238/m.19338 type:complete len:103 (-) Transcript_21238:183-491(-)